MIDIFTLLVFLVIVFIALPIILLSKFPNLRKAIGLILLIIGLLISLSGIGAIIGIPMIIVGAFLLFIGGTDSIDGLLEKTKEAYISGQNERHQNKFSEKYRICPNCGIQNDRTNKYCSDCGFKFNI